VTRGRTLLALLALVLAASCRHPAPTAPPATPAPSPLPARVAGPWARKTLRSLSLEQKAAQMIGVRAYGLYHNPRSRKARELAALVRDVGVGSVVVFDSEVESLPRLVDDLQKVARVPLLVAADLERGMAFRIRRGTVPLPYAMAIGATGSEDAARFTGEETAREARALGIQWAFAPVADVNNNPDNPVINIRSYGEDPELVARLVSAYVRGVHSGGLLATAKHFPGHGDTAVDSHLQLARIDGDRERLEHVELEPFRAAIAAGVDAVMVGHIAAPALDPSGAPATLSAPITTGVLRQELGFKGLIVTDALEMSGVRAAWTGEAVVKAVQAGADVLLLPPDPHVAIQSLVRGVREGQLSEARIDESVLRILEAKERLGLDQRRFVDAGALGAAVDRPEDVQQALAVARASITLVRNAGDVLPLRAERPLSLLHLVMSSDIRNDAIEGIPEAELKARRIPTRTIALGPEVSDATADRIVLEAAEYTHVLVSAFVRVTSAKGTTDMSESHARLLERLAATGRPVIVVSYGSPYLLRQFPAVPVYLCAYGGVESSQRAAIGALFGEYALTGRLPVSLPGLVPRGTGIRLPRHDMTLREAPPESVGFKPGAMGEVDRVVDEFIARRAFPGAVLAVGKDGALVHLKAFGHQSYAADSPPVTPTTLYDLASVTKVVVTTTMAMMLVDEGKLDLNKPVSAFLPGFRGGEKDKVTVWHLLTHSSGVDWWAPLYEKAHDEQGYLKLIEAMDLKFEPGTKSVYSDLGILLLGQILERVSGQSLDAFARERIFAPLGMHDTLYRPGPELLPRIAPTEVVPWRGGLVHGVVHDENAWGLGGIAPHAGLFSTAPDLARFAQMLLNGGVYDNHRLVSRATVELFTRRAGVPGSSRALGWDTPSPPSSAGTLFSPRSFGHTGFTGTSLWMDPDRQLFLILLTNRVNPTRENNLIREARPAVADAVVRGLVDPSLPQP
jgi:beta-N-acetylhexosaminidase